MLLLVQTQFSGYTYFVMSMERSGEMAPMQCLKQWVSVQNDKKEADYLCPVCRGSCVAYLHNCNGSTCERVLLQPAVQPDHNRHDGFVLSTQHRIRRAVYIHSNGNAPSQTDPCDKQRPEMMKGMAKSTASPLPSGTVQLRTIADPVVSQWLRRELQALLLMAEPGLVQLVRILASIPAVLFIGSGSLYAVCTCGSP